MIQGFMGSSFACILQPRPRAAKVIHARATWEGP